MKLATQKRAEDIREGDYVLIVGVFEKVIKAAPNEFVPIHIQFDYADSRDNNKIKCFCAKKKELVEVSE